MPVTIDGSNTPTAGGVVYGDGTEYASTAAGTSGQVLTSSGSGAPTWTTVSGSSQWTTSGSNIYYNTGNVGIGTASPATKLHVNGTGTVIQQLQSTSGAVELKLIANSQSNASYSNIYSGDGTNWNWTIGGSNGTSNTMTFVTGGTERMRLNNTGALVFAGGDTAANGIGITFPATQSASSNANTLDDYEEGTWTPGLTSAGGAFTGLSVSSSGTYTKIGNTVVVRGTIHTTSSFSGGSGQVYISGLPFFTATFSVGGIRTDDNTGVFNQPSALATLVLSSGTELRIFKNGSVANNAFVTTNLTTSAGNGNPFTFSCTYLV